MISQLSFNDAKVVTTLGTRDEQVKSHQADIEELSGAEASRYRMVTARLKHLAMDRPDIQYAVKEASKHMAKPRLQHWALLKRIGR